MADRPRRTGIKRKRAVLSCLVCKRRKVKCDKNTPICSRCSEGGLDEQCSYDDPMANARNTEYPTASGKEAVSSASRLSQIAESNTMSNTQASTEGAGVVNHFRVDVGQALPRNVQFHGTSHSINIISYFPDFRDFLERFAAEHPLLGHHHRAVENLITTKTRPQQSPGTTSLDTEQVLRRATPTEAECRRYMQLYFKHFEGIYRIIHGPSFWRKFDAFWAGTLANPSPFLALLLAAVSCARCLHVDNPLSFNGDSSTARNDVISWLQAVEHWHDEQSFKHTTLDVMQVKCCFILSRWINAIKIKEHYIRAQNLMATALSFGLHKNSYGLRKRASFYLCEMYQRIWFTISEIELTASIERGLPSLAASLCTNTNPSGDLRDEDFDETTEEGPVLPTRDVCWTESSAARFSHSLRPLCFELSNIVNDGDSYRPMTTSDLQEYTQQIFDKLFELRSWPMDPPSLGYTDAIFLGCTSLQVQLHKLLNILHLRFAMDQSSKFTSSYSRFVCVNSARSVIALYARLPERGFSQMCLIRTELVRATLCLCLIQPCSFGHGE